MPSARRPPRRALSVRYALSGTHCALSTLALGLAWPDPAQVPKSQLQNHCLLLEVRNVRVVTIACMHGEQQQHPPGVGSGIPFIFRIAPARPPRESKQVNGRRVTIPSFMCKAGDIVSIKEKSREIPMVLEAVASSERDVPDYAQVDFGKMTGTFLREPKLEDVPYPVQMEPNLVVEFYSRT